MSLNKKNNHGFSLIEVLVAFSIFALSLGVIFQIYSTGTRSTLLGDEYSRATVIAQSKLAAIGIEENQSLGESTGIEDNKYQWTIRIEPTENEDEYLESTHKTVKRNVEIEVDWQSRGKSRVIKLNTIKLIPVS